MITRFRDRAQAGRLLVTRLGHHAGRDDLLVLALPRGGVPVGLEIARALDAPLDVMVVRKLGMPGQEELAVGAIASGGIRIVNDEVVRMMGLGEETLERVTAREREEVARRERAYRGDRPPPEVRGRTVILVDDGAATGSTMRAAIDALREQGPDRVIAAIPTAPPAVCETLATLADEAICLLTPDPFMAIGLWYDDFPQLTDDEVRRLLAETPRPSGGRPPETGEG